MDKKKIFLAAPISGFLDDNEYRIYRETVLELIVFLRNNHFEVFSEIEKVIGSDTYDSPAESVIEDFDKIDNSTIFLYLHPKKVQTSGLVELGYAFAKKKHITIVGLEEDLPYLVRGFPMVVPNVHVINVPNLHATFFSQILRTL